MRLMDCEFYVENGDLIHLLQNASIRTCSLTAVSNTGYSSGDMNTGREMLDRGFEGRHCCTR